MNKILLFILLSSSVTGLLAQDSLVLMNHDIIVGEVKSMDKGVVLIETDYSDSDFKIEWEKVVFINTETRFFFTLRDGSRYSGVLVTDTARSLVIKEDDGRVVPVVNDDIVNMRSIDNGFWDQFYASIDFGLSITKANELKTFSTNSQFGYRAERWTLDAYYSAVNSTQQDAEPTKRNDAGIGFNYLLPKDWYIPAKIAWLSNTEQKIDVRTTISAGVGNFIIHTNQTHWGVKGGLNFNNENFTTLDPSRTSLEGFFGTEFNMYDVGDISLLTSVSAYPSITESGRWRVDVKFDLKYDLPLDFYIKFGTTVNYDNQAVDGASDTDYVIQTNLGWEW